MSRAMLSLLRESTTVIGRKQSKQQVSAVAKKADSKLLAVLIDSVANLDSIERIEIGGIDGENLVKLQSLISRGRDFTKTSREMELTIQRFLKALFAGNPSPTMREIDATIEEAVIGVIALRLRTGGGDVKSSFKPLTAQYQAYKRKKYPNAKGIGWATGELAHEWAEYGNVRIVRK